MAKSLQTFAATQLQAIDFTYKEASTARTDQSMYVLRQTVQQEALQWHHLHCLPWCCHQHPLHHLPHQ
jgi:hypothetical protein